jgi:UDP-N-acetylmuramoylalanine--D-glutamate ligase
VDLGPADVIRPAGAHNVSNALHAAALARAYGVDAAAVAAGLAGYTPEPHRNALVCTMDGVGYVDDSKATNPHAAGASLAGYPRVVWIAGGLLKGADAAQLDELVAAVLPRLRGVVLLGVDRMRIAEALARHAPDVPVVDVGASETVDVMERAGVDVMDDVVSRAAELARPGDVVLLAPAAASMDMFAHYGARGDAFEAAVRRWAEGHGR